MRGKEDPFAKIGTDNDRTKKSESDFVWVLKDINFEVNRGDTLGIIGKNGAGKSTLLKLLSRVTMPTNGSIKARGRIASLLEVGTGFHPELTGRENVFMNGAILGMTKREITAKFDEIVDFAGVEKYIDTPVKRYSSGMYVRLAFAVAAFLEPEILIVDEVLAVGDAEFQKKCLGRMKDVSVNDGRTVLFVSHNMTAIQSLCNKSILLEHGKLKMSGPTNSVIDFYLNNYSTSVTTRTWELDKAPGDSSARVTKIQVLNRDLQPTSTSLLEDEICIEFTYQCLVEGTKLNISIDIITDKDETVLTSPSLTDEKWCGMPHPVGTYVSRCWLPANFFNDLNYKLHLLFVKNASEIIAHVEDAVVIQKFDSGLNRRGYFGHWRGITRPILQWETERQ